MEKDPSNLNKSMGESSNDKSKKKNSSQIITPEKKAEISKKNREHYLRRKTIQQTLVSMRKNSYIENVDSEETSVDHNVPNMLPLLANHTPEVSRNPISTHGVAMKVLQREKDNPDIVSCREYYCYKLQIRNEQLSLLLRAGRLLQQYVVDMYVKIESSRLDYIEMNQETLRCELYSGVVDAVTAGEDKAAMVGKKTILPASFIGGPRDMKKRYMDAMALVQKYECKDILYRDFPASFVWSKKDRLWTSRRKGICIGRIVAASPAEGSRYYLRILLNHIKGATSFDNLKLVNGVQATTFCEAAILHGLLLSDKMHEECLREASTYHMPSQLRRLFATLLVFCNPPNPLYLWDTFKLVMSEDFALTPNVLPSTITSQVLHSINLSLQSMGKTLADYGFINENFFHQNNQTMNREINDELNIVVPKDHVNAARLLNRDQRLLYESILQRIFRKEPGAFFLDGPGGTGKTFLYCALLRTRGLVAIATATSGIAASIMPGGRTSHSRFKIPINIDDISTCSVSKQSGLADLLRTSSLIIWDEASMAKRQAVEALDRMLQDIMDSQLLFGGKVIVFGGDFRQILPVVPRSTMQEAIDASLLKSYIWPLLEKFKLTINMRAQLDSAFCDFLLRVGNGIEPIVMNGKIRIPSEMLLPYKDDTTSMNDLVDIVFPNICSYDNNYDSIVKRVILTPKNDFVDELNSILINRFPGSMTRYYSQDEAVDSSVQAIEEDFLNGLNPSGFPPHELLLKSNCPVILLRNLAPTEGLSNGTRLICKSFTQNVIEAEIAMGDHRGKHVFIPRIPFLPNEDTKNPFPFRRTQFPVRLSFTMTVNKSQGQTLDFVGIYLPQSVFSHGQLYVALSRAQTSKNVCVLIRPPSQKNEDLGCTHNVVYSDLLQLVDD